MPFYSKVKLVKVNNVCLGIYSHMVNYKENPSNETQNIFVMKRVFLWNFFTKVNLNRLILKT